MTVQDESENITAETDDYPRSSQKSHRSIGLRATLVIRANAISSYLFRDLRRLNAQKSSDALTNTRTRVCIAMLLRSSILTLLFVVSGIAVGFDHPFAITSLQSPIQQPSAFRQEIWIFDSNSPP